jgi:hypothetical protein
VKLRNCLAVLKPLSSDSSDLAAANDGYEPT